MFFSFNSDRNLLAAAAIGGLILAIAAPSLINAEAQHYGYVQANCPNIVKQAIDTVSAQCGKTTRGKLCYGNSNITAQFQPGVNTNTVKFQAPGDTVDVNAIKQFTLSGMSTTDNSWGVAEMKIKADLPDANPSQAVTMILFGDVQITDASADAQPLAATLTAVVMQTVGPAQTATPLLNLFDQPTATPTGSKKVPPSATSTRTAVPTSQILYSGLQAFYFQSSDTAPCDQAPHNGMLIQSPQGDKQRVNLIIDGASISLGSTVYITAQPGRFLTINTLEGSAVVTVAGRTRTAYAGTALQVPLDANLRASGAPAVPQYYSADTARALPVSILPVSAAGFVSGLPTNLAFTSWTVTSQGSGCSGGNNPGSYTGSSNLAYNGQALWFAGTSLVLVSTRQDSYGATVVVDQDDTMELGRIGIPIWDSAANIISLTVLSPTHLKGTNTAVFYLSGGSTGCVFNFDFTKSP